MVTCLRPSASFAMRIDGVTDGASARLTSMPKGSANLRCDVDAIDHANLLP